jgi:hypothetical protein
MRDDRPDFGRRFLMQRLAVSAGGLMIFPAVLSSHPIQHHLRDQIAVGLADENASAPDYVPVFLDTHQLEMLQLLAERIVPGSAKANSAPFIDQLLAVATVDEQREFLQALGGLEGLARARAGTSWTQLTETQHDALLTVASTAKAGTLSGTRGSRTRAVTIRDHFENLKGWIVGAYYSSEPGMRELGWTEGVFFPAFPGCDHPGGHA